MGEKHRQKSHKFTFYFQVSAMMLKIAFICITFLITSSYAIDFEPKEEKTGVIFLELAKPYVSYNRWHICFYYDVTDYFDEIEKLKFSLIKLKEICSILHYNESCQLINQQLDKHLDSIAQDSNKIESFQTTLNRRKRAPFEFMGKIYNILFGLMDAESARAYDDKINELQNVSTKTSNLIDSETLLVKNSLEINTKIYKNLTNVIKKLSTEIIDINNELNSTIKNIYTKQKYEEITSTATLIIIQQNKISKELLSTLQNSIDGKIASVIPINRLKENLKIISNNLSENQKLPINLKSENIYHLFKITNVRATLYNKKILIELSIPIIEKTIYSLYKSIPIPTFFNGNYLIMKTKNTYFLANLEHYEYIPLDSDELQNCKHTFNNDLICTPYSPIYYNKDKICELNVLTSFSLDKIYDNCKFNIVPKTNYIIQINNQDKYYCVVDKPFIISSKCYNNEIEVKQINNSGILQINPNCVVKTEEIKLKSHNVKYFNDTKLVIPNHDLSLLDFKRILNINYTINHTKLETILIQNYDTEFDSLIEQADSILEENKDKIKFEEIHYDKIKHTFWTGTLSLISISILIGGIYLFFTKIKPISNILSMIYNFGSHSISSGNNARENITLNIVNPREIITREPITREIITSHI